MMPVLGKAQFASLCLAVLVACQSGGNGSPESDTSEIDDRSNQVGWVGTWATAPYGPYPLGPLSESGPEEVVALTTPGFLPDDQASNQSFRMIVHPSLGGRQLRIRFSNLKGDRPIDLEPVTVALRAAGGGAAIIPSTNTPVEFQGQKGVTISPGEEAISDAVELPFTVDDDLVISFRVAGESGPLTWHAVSFDTQFISPPESGDQTSDPTGAAFPGTSVGWFLLGGVDVFRPDAVGAIVAIGDSITDGAFQAPGSNTRWPDLLAERLQDAGIPMGVLNEGINSNTVTKAGSEPYRGPPAVQRFDRDVLQRAGVRSVIIFEGTNDLTAGADDEAVLEGLHRLVERAHSAGLCVVLGTITPRDDLIFGWDRETMEPDRQAINEAIRNSIPVEGIADFDRIMRDPVDGTRPNPALYSPDLLHPNSVGFNRMADAVPIKALAPPPFGECQR